MRYYLIAGEASGDLHASHLMQQLKKQDAEAEFRFFGGDKMKAVGGTLVKHYKELAYMGFIPVLLHLRTIFNNMKMCKRDIDQWQPDNVILIDYPGFNLSIAEYLNKKRKGKRPQISYYISPKIWAWKEYRIKNIKRDIDHLYSILPFEIPFFEQKHGYKIDYVGNPTAQEVREFTAKYTETKQQFCLRHDLPADKPIIAILPGSRKQEIKSNGSKMIAALHNIPYVKEHHATIVIAGAPGIEPEYYQQAIDAREHKIIFNETYKILTHAHAALVVSGTATLETALFRVPQVVVYETGFHWLFKTLRRLLLKVRWVSLVNLIANKEVVPEMVADTCTVQQISANFAPLLDSSSPERVAQLTGYIEVAELLSEKNAPVEASRLILQRASTNVIN